MPTQLTQPITRSDTHATLDGWELLVRRNLPGLGVDVAASQFMVDLTFRNGNGMPTRSVRFTRAGSDLPPVIRSAIADLQSALVTYMRAQGVLPAGIDTADFP